MSRRHVGLLLAHVGNALVIVAFFCPWVEVYKLNDPSFPFPKRGYSPWMALQRGELALAVVAWLFLLIIFGMVLSSSALTFVHTARRRTQARFIARALAVVSLVLMLLAIPTIVVDLSFSWPYLNSNVVYGVYFAAAGFLIALIGLSLFTE